MPAKACFPAPIKNNAAVIEAFGCRALFPVPVNLRNTARHERARAHPDMKVETPQPPEPRSRHSPVPLPAPVGEIRYEGATLVPWRQAEQLGRLGL